MPGLRVKTFSATKSEDRQNLGDQISSWLRKVEGQGVKIIDKSVLQSSDNAFHCLSVVIFYEE